MAKTDLIMHTPGGKFATWEDLKAVAVPQETDTYKPLPYTNLVEMTREIASARLTNFSLHKETFGLNKTGGQMFGVLRYANQKDPDLQLAIGMRTSYDKTLATAMCMGGSIFICDNLAFSANIHIFRKHTGYLMLNDLETMIVRAVYAASSDYQKIQIDRDLLMQVQIDDRDAHHMLMVLGFREKVLSPNQFEPAYLNWERPPHEEFEPRTMWSLYNSVNQALKSSPAGKVFETHIGLHNYLTTEAKKAVPDWISPEPEVDLPGLAERIAERVYA